MSEKAEPGTLGKWRLQVEDPAYRCVWWRPARQRKDGVLSPGLHVQAPPNTYFAPVLQDAPELSLAFGECPLCWTAKRT